MQLHQLKRPDSSRSVPPRWLPGDAVVAAHTAPPATASAVGGLPSENRRSRLRDLGSIRITVSVLLSATQMAPSPAAIALGCPPTATVSSTTFVAASILVTVPAPRLATPTPPHPPPASRLAPPTPPYPTGAATGPSPTAIAFRGAPDTGSSRITSASSSPATHT